MRSAITSMLTMVTACFVANPNWDAADRDTGTTAVDGASDSASSMSVGASSNTADSAGTMASTTPDTGQQPPPEDWWDAAWSMRRPLLVNPTTGEGFEDFTIPIVLSARAFSEASDGFVDLRFVDEAGNVLPHQFERDLNGVSESIVWVPFPILGGPNGTKVWVYYGNPSATDTSTNSGIWNSDYVAVWHLASATEASDQGHDLTVSQSAGFRDSCATGACVVIQNLSEGLSVAGQVAAFVDLASDAMTISAWINPQTAGGSDQGRIVDKLVGEGIGGFAFGIGPEPGGTSLNLSFTRGMQGGPVTTSGLPSITLREWHHVAVVYDAPSEVRLYHDGEGVSTTDPLAAPADTDFGRALTIGARLDSTEYAFDGSIDEVRISSVARSDAWIAAEYNASNGTLVNLGNAEAYE